MKTGISLQPPIPHNRYPISCLRAEQGATAMEFAIIFPIFLLFMMGLFEIALITWGNGVLNNVISRAAQTSTAGCLDNDVVAAEGAAEGECVTTAVTGAFIQELIREKGVGFIRPEKLCFSATRLADIAGGEEFRPGKALDLGQAEDIVVFYARYNWDVMFSFMRPVFGNAIDFESVSMVRNDKFLPYGNAARNQPSLKGCMG